jgi:hypothetical protein
VHPKGHATRMTAPSLAMGMANRTEDVSRGAADRADETSFREAMHPFSHAI